MLNIYYERTAFTEPVKNRYKPRVADPDSVCFGSRSNLTLFLNWPEQNVDSDPTTQNMEKKTLKNII